MNIRLVHAINNAIIEELIIRDPSRPNNFNNKTTAECLKVIIHRSPQLRRTILTKLRDIAFEDDLEIRERAAVLQSLSIQRGAAP